MRFVPGFTLTALLRSRTLGARRAVALPRQVADGLGAAHAAEFVHCDVKPADVLVEDADHACLGDFGIIRAGTSSAVTVTDASWERSPTSRSGRAPRRGDARLRFDTPSPRWPSSA